MVIYQSQLTLKSKFSKFSPVKYYFSFLGFGISLIRESKTSSKVRCFLLEQI